MSNSALATHHRDPVGLRVVVALFGIPVLCVLAYVSARMNFRFGSGLATNEEDALLYGMLSAAADTLKIITPFILLWAARAQMRSVWWAALGITCLAAFYGWMGAAGHFAKNRLETAGKSALGATNYTDMRDEKARIDAQLKQLGPQRDIGTIEADRHAMRTKPMWAATSSCKEGEIATRSQREFCQQFYKLDGELAASGQAAKFQVRLDEIVSKLGKTQSAAAAGGAEGGDAQASIFSRLTGGLLSVGTWQAILILVGVGIMEFGITAGPFCLFAYCFGVNLHNLALPPEAMFEEVTPGELKPVEEVIVEPGRMLAAPAAPVPEKPQAPVARAPLAIGEPLPEPGADWRALLDQLGYFHPRKGPLRQPLDKGVVGFHWLVWVYAYGRTGAYTTEQMTRLHEEFCLNAWREMGEVNIAKGALFQAARLLDKKAITKATKRGPTMWHIQPRSAAQLRKLLLRKDVIVKEPVAKTPEAAPAQAPAPEMVEAEPAKEATGGSVIPFAYGLAGPPVKAPIRGLAALGRGAPDLEAMRHLARMDKTSWKARGHSVRPRHLHRFSRARAA